MGTLKLGKIARAWQVVGYVERCEEGTDDEDSEQSFWREYLLYHREEGFAFLVDAEDGWSWSAPITGVPTPSGKGVRYQGAHYREMYRYTGRITSLNAAALASLAWAPAAPDSVTIRGAVSANTTLGWQPVTAPDLAGYRVYWREATSPTWDHSRWVGNVTEATLEGVIIDNWFFGVAAVDRDGNESLVVFPVPGR